MIGIVSIVLFSITVLCSAYVFFKKYVRPRFEANVTCWFCGDRSTVPYSERNSFECPSCDQYNGFNEDGDYNKTMPAQYDELCNTETPYCQRDEFIGGVDILCNRCSENQLLKVKQLANFVPYNEKNFEWEATAFESYMERVYRICASCEVKVQHELQMQHEALVKRFSNSEHSQSDRSLHEVPQDCIPPVSPFLTSDLSGSLTLSLALHTVALGCAMGLLLCKVDTGQSGWLEQWSAPGQAGQWSVMLHPLLVRLDRHTQGLTWLGLAASMAAKLLLGKYRLSMVDVASGPVWLLLLLIQTSFIPSTLVSPDTDLLCSVVNTLACLLCMAVGRNSPGQANVSVIRSGFGSQSVGVPDGSAPAVSEELLDGEDTDVEDVDEAVAPLGVDVDSLLDKMTGVASWIGRSTGLQRNDSGLFTPQSQDELSDSRHCTQAGTSASRPRPLISPSSFKYTSTPARHRFGGWGPQNFGLFSAPKEPVRLFLGNKSLPRSNQPPQDPVAMPVLQSFGTSPYQKFENFTSLKFKADCLARPPLRSPFLEKSSVCTQLTSALPDETGTQLQGSLAEPGNSLNTVESTALPVDSGQLMDSEETLTDSGQLMDSAETPTDSGQLMDSAETPTDNGQLVDGLVDRFLDLPTFTPQSHELQRSDSGFISCMSDCDQLSTSCGNQSSIFSCSKFSDQSVDQTVHPASPHQRQLIRSATFEYQSDPSLQDMSRWDLSAPSLVQSRGWQSLQHSETLLPTREHLTGFGTPPYDSILHKHGASAT